MMRFILSGFSIYSKILLPDNAVQEPGPFSNIAKPARAVDC